MTSTRPISGGPAASARRRELVLNGQHSSASAEWWSPPEIVDPARQAFGPIALDPASCTEANLWIRAERIFTADDDGREQPWATETVWCNPPSKRGEDAAWEWWLKAAREWSSGRARRVLFVVFNPSSFFQIAQKKSHSSGVASPQSAVRIEFRDRIRYLRASVSLGLPGIANAHVERGDAPPHGSALLLLPAQPNDVDAFVAAYAHVGDALLPARPAERAR